MMRQCVERQLLEHSAICKHQKIGKDEKSFAMTTKREFDGLASLRLDFAGSDLETCS